MKKNMMAVTAGILAGLMCAFFDDAATTESGHTDISLYVPNDPAYTITIPETVTLSATEHTQVPITASDVKYIPDGKKISVTFLKGNLRKTLHDRNQRRNRQELSDDAADQRYQRRIQVRRSGEADQGHGAGFLHR